MPSRGDSTALRCMFLTRQLARAHASPRSKVHFRSSTFMPRVNPVPTQILAPLPLKGKPTSSKTPGFCRAASTTSLSAAAAAITVASHPEESHSGLLLTKKTLGQPCVPYTRTCRASTGRRANIVYEERCRQVPSNLRPDRAHH